VDFACVNLGKYPGTISVDIYRLYNSGVFCADHLGASRAFRSNLFSLARMIAQPLPTYRTFSPIDPRCDLLSASLDRCRATREKRISASIPGAKPAVASSRISQQPGTWNVEPLNVNH